MNASAFEVFVKIDASVTGGSVVKTPVGAKRNAIAANEPVASRGFPHRIKELNLKISRLLHFMRVGDEIRTLLPQGPCREEHD